MAFLIKSGRNSVFFRPHWSDGTECYNTWPDPEPEPEPDPDPDPDPEPLNHSSITWKQKLGQQYNVFKKIDGP